MPIIGSEPIQKNYYRLTITMGGGIVDNILITPDGLYSVYFIKEGRYYNATGRIPKVMIDYCNPQRSFILFDYSADRSACRERLYFSQVQLIKDVTPNSAYKIAVEHGFVGTVEDWLESLHGDPGKSAYDIAVECGFTGTKEEWLETIKGPKGDDGRSAYQIAVNRGQVALVFFWNPFDYFVFPVSRISKAWVDDGRHGIGFMEGSSRVSFLLLVDDVKVRVN